MSCTAVIHSSMGLELKQNDKLNPFQADRSGRAVSVGFDVFLVVFCGFW